MVLMFLPTKSGTVRVQGVAVGVGLGVFVAVGVLVAVGGTVVLVGVDVLAGTVVLVGVGAPASETVIDDEHGTLLLAAMLCAATSQFPLPPFFVRLPVKPAPDHVDWALFTFVPMKFGTIHIGGGVFVAVATLVFVGVLVGIVVFVGIGVASALQPVVILREATALTLTCGM
jgi:hypothetical protein